MIGIEIVAESCFKVPYLRIPQKSTFINGEKYKLSAKIKNMGTKNFPGGNFQVIIQWSIGLSVFWNFQVKPLSPNEVIEPEYGITDVLGGPALFLAKGNDVNGKVVSFCDRWGNRLYSQPSGYTHVYSIIPKNAEALYELWALIIAVISLFPIVIKDVIIPFVQWLILGLNTLLN